MKLDHVNVRTASLDAMRQWYVDVLGLTEGWRPPFDFPGAWLYAGEDAAVHLIGVDADGAPEGRIEHFAFRGDDEAALRARLESHGVAVRELRVPGSDILQLNFRDPDGNHIHVDF